MNLRTHKLRQLCCLGLCASVLGGGVASGVGAQEIEPPVRAERKPSAIAEPSKPIEREEEAIAIAAALAKMKDLEFELEAARLKAAELSDALAESSSETQESKDQASQMRLQMEAFGIDALDMDERSLQKRLLAAVNDLRLTEKNKEALAEQLVQISEAALSYLKSGDDEARAKLTQSIEAANLSLKNSATSDQPSPVRMEESKVVSLKPEIGLAVINTGKLSGIKQGLPVRFVRADKVIAAGVVVDVRDSITGILITTTENNQTVSVGDHIKIEPTKNEKKE